MCQQAVPPAACQALVHLSFPSPSLQGPHAATVPTHHPAPPGKSAARRARVSYAEPQARWRCRAHQLDCDHQDGLEREGPITQIKEIF